MFTYRWYHGPFGKSPPAIIVEDPEDEDGRLFVAGSDLSQLIEMLKEAYNSDSQSPN